MILRLVPVVLLLAVYPTTVVTQGPVPVPIQFEVDPVLVQTGADIVFTVQTVPDVLFITWSYPGGSTALGLWTGTSSNVNPVPQYQGRVTITATQLRIASAQLRDAGNYTVEVNPSATTGLASNSRSVLLKVFVAVAGVSLSVPLLALEGTNVSLSCTWTAGTNLSVQWSKGGSKLTEDPRISFSAGSLVINPARRSDTGDYSCTVSNPISARTATRTLTVYYGPDTPVLTKSALADCVGGGNAVVGQTVQLTCVSDSLPPASFSWLQNGQPVASSQPGSGVLSVQVFSANQSGRYTCVARNSITAGTSTQGTDLTVVGTCLSGGAVAGIVIACVIALILIIIAIVLLVRWRNVDRRLNSLQKTNPNPRPVLPDLLLNDETALGQDQSNYQPLHNRNTRTGHPNQLYTLPLDANGNPRIPLHEGPNTNGLQGNGHSHTNSLPQVTRPNANSYPPNDTHNPRASTQAAPPNASTLPRPLQQSPNILIQAGSGPAGDQPATVHVSLNTQPQHNSQGQQPTVHVNLHSYPTNGQQSQPPNNSQPENTTRTANDTSAPPNSNQENVPAQLVNTLFRMQNGLSYPGDPRPNEHGLDTGALVTNGLVPTGYTHCNRSNTAQRNADTQTYRQDRVPESRGRRANGADASPVPRDALPGGDAYPRQMPWDRIRGTPAYPNDTSPRRRPSSEDSSDSTDYTSQPGTQQARNPPRSGRQTLAQGGATPRRTAPAASGPAQTLPSVPGSGLPGPDTRSTAQPRVVSPTPISPRAQRESAQQGVAALFLSQTAPGHASSHFPWRQALPRSSQQLSSDLPVAAGAPQGATAPQGVSALQGPTVLQGPDNRALADPNHLSQRHMVQPHGAAQTQTTGPQNATLPGQRAGPATAQPNPSPLTQAALQTHTRKTHNPFSNRNQQTQAALLHPGPEARATIPAGQRPPTPPPVIPLAQFRTIPRDRSRDRPLNQVTQPLRTPVNMPTAQRQPRAHNDPTTTHANAHPGNVHTHANAHKHVHAQRHAGQHAHPRQQAQRHTERR